MEKETYLPPWWGEVSREAPDSGTEWSTLWIGLSLQTAKYYGNKVVSYEVMLMLDDCLVIIIYFLGVEIIILRFD